MKKATRPPKSPAAFEQVPVAVVKQALGVPAASAPAQRKAPVDERFIVPPPDKGAKRGR
jgi:hypothetical protein